MTRYFLSFLLLATLAVHAQAQSSRKLKAKFMWEIGNTANTEQLTIRTQIPATIDRVQRVNSIKYSVEPVEVHTTDNESYAVFSFTKGNIPAEIVILTDMTIYKHGLSNQKLRKSSEPEPDLSRYLRGEFNIEVSDSVIKQLADSLKGNYPEATVRRICFFLADNIAYKSRQAGSSLATLRSKTGNCEGKSNLMTALCRANGIPARIVSGYLLDRNLIPGLDGEIGHVWVEAWLPQFGWVAFEPVRTQAVGNPLQWQFMPPDYIYLARGFRDTEIRGAGSTMAGRADAPAWTAFSV